MITLASPYTDVKKHARPWWHVGRSLSSNPFSSMGLRWCSVCKGEEDTDQEARHRGTVYLYKITCRRCGSVIGFGAVNNVPLIAATPLPQAALSWVKEAGRDRR